MKKFLPKTLNNPQGFTLIELLVVISIIAILSVIGITVYSGIQKDARDARRRNDLHAIANALEQYKNNNGKYPATTGWRHSSTKDADWIPGLSSYFSSKTVPLDPINTGDFTIAGQYGYSYYTGASSTHGGTDGGWYMLIVTLEKPKASDLTTKCVSPNGKVTWDYGKRYGKNALMICNQQ